MNLDAQRAEWSARVKLFGPQRAVLNVKNFTPAREAEFIRTQEAAVIPLLTAQLRPGDMVSLDFGCGTGRWSGKLAEVTLGVCIAIDPTPEILERATSSEWVDFLPYDGRIPAGDAHVDVIFACLVMNTILDEEMLAETIADMDRVLVSGGLVFLVDVTSRSHARTRWSVLRSVEEYAEAFAPIAPLRLLGEYLDLGETHSIMAGRKA